MARQSGKVIDLLDGNQSAGAPVGQYTSSTGAISQQWRVEERTCVFSPTTCYKISSRNGGKVIGVLNGSKDNGAQLRQQTYAGKASQQWKMQLNADGYYQIANGNRGKLIDVYGGFTDNFTNLIQWASTGGQNQQWKITLGAQGYYTFLARHSGKMMDQKGGIADENVEIIQYSATGAVNQQWTIDPVGCAATGSRVGADDYLTASLEQTDNPYILYPNPARMLVNVDLRAAQGKPASIALTDLKDKILYSRLVDSGAEPYHTIGISEYAEGIYLISIDVAEKSKTTLRLLIER